MDADIIQIIIFLVLTIFLLLRLKNVLGTKTGHENTERSLRSVGGIEANKEDSEDALPIVAPIRPQFVDADLHMYVDTGSDAEKALREIGRADSDFNLEDFLEGAKSAYEIMITAFEEDDRQNLKEYGSADVYEGFLQALEERKVKGHTVESKFIGVRDAQIMAAGYSEETRVADITLRFVAERTRAVRNSSGEVIEGDLVDTQRMTDTWTFTRRVGSFDPNWILTAID